jgi:integrase
VVREAKAGLGQGELLALRWSDVDLVAGRLVVRRSVWRGVSRHSEVGHELGRRSLTNL